MRESKGPKRFISIVSSVIIISFTTLTMSPTYLAVGSESSSIYNLSPQHGVFGPMTDSNVEEKRSLELVVLGELVKESGIILKNMDVPRNLFLKFKGSDESIDAVFEAAEFLDVTDGILSNGIEKIILIPARFGDTPYCVEIFVKADGGIKSAVYSLDDFSDHLEEDLIPSGIVHPADAENLFQRMFERDILKDRKTRFVGLMDEGVQSVLTFLEAAGAVRLGGIITKVVSEKNVLLVSPGDQKKREGVIEVTEAAEEKARASAILEQSMIATQVKLQFGDVKEAFSEFWDMWKENKGKDFDLDRIDPKLNLLVKDMEQSLSDGSNEGSIEFVDIAYTRMLDVTGIRIEDCKPTIRDIKRIFREIAEYYMPGKLKESYKLYKVMRNLEVRMDKAVKESEFEAAAKYRDEINEVKAKLTIERENGNIENDNYEEIFAKLPGLNTDLIVIEHVSDGMLPTDIVTEDGTIRVNENFVKLMYQMSLRGLKGETGKIYAYPKSFTPEVIGDLYESILYSLAIHSIKGHLPFNEEGFVEFTKDEYMTQGERGDGHLYVNTLAMLYYWIMLIEHYEKPYQRVKFYMDKYPHLFRKLTEEQKKKLPMHLVDLCEEQLKRGMFPLYNYQDVPTGMTREDVKNIMKQYPDSASNEGIPGSEEENLWAHSVVDSFLEGKSAQELVKEGKQMIFALEDEWMPEVQKTFIQPLIQEFEKLGDASPVKVVRKEKKETVEEFAARLERMRQESGLEPEDMIVMASASNVKKHHFDNLKVQEKFEEHSPLIIGVDNANLSDDSYVRLMEMITMAMRMAYGQTAISEHPNIKKQAIGDRTFIFIPIPPAKPLGYNEIKDLYEKQLKILRAA